MNLRLMSTTAALLVLTGPAFADMEAARAFLDAEIGDLSSLTREEQEAEMQWFIDAAQPFRGMSINVVSETITTHEYEARVLAPAFTAITGIQVTHDLIGEGDVVEKLQTQMQTGENIYDAYINDSDLIGTHWRYQQVRILDDWMTGEGASVTNPNLDIEDFIGRSFTTAPDGKLYQLPTQQFANLYWFRYDWFNDPKNMADFEAEVRLPAGRSGQLVGLRGHRRVLHRPRPVAHGRDRPGLRPHGLRQEGPLARLALHRCVDVDGRHGRRGRAERPAGGRMGHPGGRELASRGLLHGARRGDERRGRRLCRDEGDRVARQVRAARPPRA
jgi:hypothetical protein